MAAELTTQMRAFVTPRQGGDTIELVELPVPKIDDDEVLVHIRAVGVGIHDSYFLPNDRKYPFPIGIEAAGVVDEVGSQVSSCRKGDRVAFVSAMQPKGGTWAEYAAVKATSLIMQIPSAMDFTYAAAIPVAGNTVLRALAALPKATAGRSVFVAGGSGAIGTLAIQIARQRGWQVGASASAANHDYMRSLGAEYTVDYHDPDWTARVREWRADGVDAAITVQPGTSVDTLRVIRDGGDLVTISGDKVETSRGVRVQMVPNQTDVRTELAQLMEQITSGTVHLELEHVYPFDEAPAALARVQTRHTRGKLVLRLQ